MQVHRYLVSSLLLITAQLGFAQYGPTTFSGSSGNPIVTVTQDDLGAGLKSTNTCSFCLNANGIVGQTNSNSHGAGVVGLGTATTGQTYGVLGQAAGPGGIGTQGYASGTSGSTIGVYGVAKSSSGTAGVFDNRAGGNILSGRVNGLNKFRVNGAGRVFADGGVQASGADFAESVRVKGEPRAYEPGDLLVIDPSAKRQLVKSTKAYATSVAGIYSTRPGILATPRQIDEAIPASEIPLAVVGIVPCKVSAENGPVRVGDLLVASSTAGYAMKGSNRSRLVGAVVGKAMEPLNKGKGLIEVLVTLQ